MKNILMMMLGVGLTLSAIAGGPKVANGGKIGGGTPSKVIVVRPYTFYPYRFGFSPFYSPFYGYNSFYYSPFGYSPFGFQRQPSKLDLEIEQITNDYRHQIAEVRHDKTLPKAERKQKIRDLRHERANSILEAKKDFYDREENDTE